MYKLTWCNESDMLKEIPYLDKFHFNHLPKPFKIVSQKEYEDYEDTWYPQFVGIGQIHNDEEKQQLLGEGTEASTIHMKYSFFNTHGYAKCKFRKKVVVENEKYGNKYNYVDDVIYIRFGCDHKGAEMIDSDVFERTYKCPECGLVWSEQTGY